MAPEATLPRSVVNVPGDYFSMAGFEVIMYGRFWVFPEAPASNRFSTGRSACFRPFP